MRLVGQRCPPRLERLLVSTENLTRAECATRAATVTVVHYDIQLDLTDVANSATFGSVTTLEFTATAGSSTWIDLMAPEIVHAELNGVAIGADKFDGNRLQLENLAAENKLVVNAKCEYSNTGEGLHKFVDPADNEIYLYSQFEIADARRVFACFDQPDLKGTYQFTVDAPAHWKVFSNTFAENVTLDNGVRHIFAPTKKMSTYITAIVAGNYYGVTDWYTGEYGTYPLGLYCRNSLSEHLEVEEMMLVTKQGFEVFERDFGQGYPFDKYDQIIVPEFNAGAMENAGCVTFYEGVIYRGRATDHERESRANTILHELAHMWFGNLVTMTWWDDIWLNESFAEWAAHYASAAGTRFDQAWTSFLVDRKFWAYREDQMSGTHPIATDMIDLDTVEVNFDGITYAKGASTLRQLVAFVGEADFLKGISNYFTKHAWGNTELRDLLIELEAASGRDLSEFTNTWLKTSGVNLMRPEIELNADGTFARVTVIQEPPAEPAGLEPSLRKHRMAIGLYNKTDKGLERTLRVEVDVEGARTEIAQLVGSKQPDLLLLNDGDLTYTKIRLDERSLKTAVESLGTIPDSLARATILSAAGDMNRDAEMTTGDFIELVLRAIPSETYIPIIQRLLAQTRTTAQVFAHPSKREGYLVRLADAFLTWSKTLPVGSDAQFASARNFVAIARTPEQIAEVKALLNGTGAIDGIKIDADFRWSLLGRLVSRGEAGENEIATEEASDVTSTGKAKAAAARAAVPTVEAKQKAWNAIFNDDELSNEIMSSMIGGFMQVDQTELLAQFSAPYFEALLTVWETKSNEIAQTITIGLFPSLQITEATVAAANAFLERDDIPFGCKRLVGEGRDSIVRSLAAQKADA